MLLNQKNEYESKINDLQDKLADIAKSAVQQPKSTTTVKNNIRNNVYANMPPISDLTREYIQTQVDEHFDSNYFVEGQKGVARFAYNKLLKDEDGTLYVECTDPSRHVYRFKDQDGNIIRDLKARRLTSMIAEPVKLKSRELMMEIDPESCYDFTRIAFMKIKQMDRDNTDFCSELSTLTSEFLLSAPSEV
jgi:hypothetical protein